MMSPRIAFAAVLASAGLMLHGAVLADPPPGKGKNRGEAGTAESSTLVRAGISVEAVWQIMGETGVPRGGYKPLPPGIAKNLARGKPLPPGIAKRYPPGAMVGRLPVHPGYEWRIAGTDLILVQIGTQVVADVLKRVFE